MSILDELKAIYTDLKKLRADIRKESTDRINKNNLRTRAEGIASLWFSSTEVIIRNFDFISKERITYYHDNFTRLLKISSPANKKNSYLDILKDILSTFNDDLILLFITTPETKGIKKFEALFIEFKDIPEYDYILESIKCAENGFFRAATVLGWSATVFRFHNVIEHNIGFDNFNLMSNNLSDINQGRFKRFNKKFSIAIRSELLEVFDTDLLWILEGLELIDINEHTRLTGCFTLRCQAAHPCNAIITEPNLLSFFSDIKEIVFKNTKFNL